MEDDDGNERRREQARLSTIRRKIKRYYPAHSEHRRLVDDYKPPFESGFGHGLNRAFEAGRRAGVWLAFNGPRARRIGAAPPPAPAPAAAAAAAAAPAPAAAAGVFAAPEPREEQIPELPLDQYEPDGYNQFTTQQLRERLEQLRLEGRNPELMRIQIAIRKRKQQDIRAVKRAIRLRERQELQQMRDNAGVLGYPLRERQREREREDRQARAERIRREGRAVIGFSGR